ncbi:MAG: hypothetical protein AAFR52_10820 [Pseudomonadota bacterium]
MRIAIAACARNPSLSRSNACYRHSLEARGAEVAVLAWNRDPMAAFLRHDLVVLRQTWDYQEDPGGFAAWLVRLEALGGRVEAPAPLAIWNNDKRTLVELGAAGIPIPETVALRDGVETALPSGTGTDRIVLKPAFGGDGVGVGVCNRAEIGATLRELHAEAPGRPYMAQAFLPEIGGGEWKMTVIEGAVALAVRAVPRAGEFRINTRFGPSIEVATPPAAARRCAERVMQIVGTPLCGRVDGVMRGDGFICTEVELCDPDLHLHHDPTVADHLAERTLVRARCRTGG